MCGKHFYQRFPERDSRCPVAKSAKIKYTEEEMNIRGDSMGMELQAPVIWLILFAVMIVAEIATLGLTTIWFAGGALAALALSMAGAGGYIQIIVFLIVSFLLLVLVRPWAKKHFNHGRIRTNAQGLIGQSAIVIEAIDNALSQGRVSVGGQEWAARNAKGDEPIRQNAHVVIREISGVKLLVEESEKGTGK